MGDARRLTQLFSNLYSKTASATLIQVAVSKCVLSSRDDTAIVTVSDSKPGVSDAECDRLFERLYRVESSRSRALGGSGLGLSICKSIAQAHDGAIKAAPASAGGLTITLSIPLATP